MWETNEGHTKFLCAMKLVSLENLGFQKPKVFLPLCLSNFDETILPYHFIIHVLVVVDAHQQRFLELQPQASKHLRTCTISLEMYGGCAHMPNFNITQQKNSTYTNFKIQRNRACLKIKHHTH